MSSHRFTRLLAFDRDTIDFVCGFEAGRVWTQLQADALPQDFMLHTLNAEMMVRIAEATERAFRAELVDDEWVRVHFDYAGSAVAA